MPPVFKPIRTEGLLVRGVRDSLDTAHWGMGYATEASEALVEWLFADERLTMVEGMLHPDNIASARIPEKRTAR